MSTSLASRLHIMGLVCPQNSDVFYGGGIYVYVQGPPKKCIHTLTKENSTLYN